MKSKRFTFNEGKFDKLCKTCDRVLKDHLTNERIGIDWLHILNEHPVNLSKYAELFDVSKFNVYKKIRSIIATLLQVLKSVNVRKKWYSSKKLPKCVDVIIISNFINKSHSGVASDFYFGSIAEILQEKGVEPLVILRDHTNSDLKSHLSRWSGSLAPRLVFERYLSLKQELILRNRQRKEALLLIREAKYSENSFDRKVKKQAAHLATSSSTMATLRFHTQLIDIIKQLKPKTIVVPYEGHAYERLVFSAAREVSPDILCVAYQHAILFPRQHSIKQSLGEAYDPDTILTSGKVNSELLCGTLKSKKTKVVTVGTHRRLDLDTNNENCLDTKTANFCLVIPDGILSECITMLRFLIEAAILIPEVIFIFRLHPNIFFGDVTVKPLKSFPSNIDFSNRSIEDDIKLCKWSIYRGSGAVVYSVLAGLRPFYLAVQDELEIDTLYKLSKWKKIIKSKEELLHLIRLDINRVLGSEKSEFHEAKDFCSNYFTPLDEERFIKEIFRNKNKPDVHES